MKLYSLINVLVYHCHVWPINIASIVREDRVNIRSIKLYDLLGNFCKNRHISTMQIVKCLIFIPNVNLVVKICIRACNLRSLKVCQNLNSKAPQISHLIKNLKNLKNLKKLLIFILDVSVQTSVDEIGRIKSRI